MFYPYKVKSHYLCLSHRYFITVKHNLCFSSGVNLNYSSYLKIDINILQVRAELNIISTSFSSQQNSEIKLDEIHELEFMFAQLMILTINNLSNCYNKPALISVGCG